MKFKKNEIFMSIFTSFICIFFLLQIKTNLNVKYFQNSHIISFSEFTELLKLVDVNSISSLDPQLMALVSKPISWYQSLTRLLCVKYQDSSRYCLCFFFICALMEFIVNHKILGWIMSSRSFLKVVCKSFKSLTWFMHISRNYNESNFLKA